MARQAPDRAAAVDAAAGPRVGARRKRDPHGRRPRLCLTEFGRTEGRELPRKLSVSGRGFELDVRFNDVKVEFIKRP
jgi:hypothetical protein